MTEEQQILPYRQRTPQRMEPRVIAPLTVEGADAEWQPALNDYWRVILRRRWTVVTAVAIVTTVVAVFSFRMKPVYRATARVEVDNEVPSYLLNSEFYRPLPDSPDFVRTQIQVLQADTLAWRTIEQLGLGESPDFAPAKKGTAAADYPDGRKMQLLRTFKQRLDVELVPGSRVIKVSFEGTDRALAAKVANTLVDDYVDYNFRQKYDATRQSAGRMEQQLDELKIKVERSQRELVDYQREHAIVDASDKQSVVEQRLAELSTQLTAAQSDRIQRESLYRQVVANPAKVASLAQNELLRKLEEEYAELKQQYVEASQRSGPAFPKVVRLEQQVEEQQALIDRERSRVVERIRNDYAAAVGRETLLAQAVSRQKAELGEFNKLLVQQNILKGEFEANQQLYQRLLQHLKDATISAGLRSSNIHVVDAALPAPDPVRPKKLLYIVLGLLAGLVLGVLLGFVQEGLDSSIKSAEELEGLVHEPALAIIPVAQPLGPRQALALGKGRAVSQNGNLQLAVLHHPNSPLAESYRCLRTSTLLSLALRPPQALLVTSANAGEGKTTTAVNLAVALAQQQDEVLLIDCDLRQPGIARSLHLDNRRGLSSVLAGRSALEESLRQFAELPKLWTLTAGPMPPNPAELLSSPGMENLLRAARERFRHIVLDSPPLLMVTDGTVLSALVDGVILVVESGATPRKAVVRACRILQGAGAKMLGVALNKVDLRFDWYYGPYSYGGYSYGQEKAGVRSQ